MPQGGRIVTVSLVDNGSRDPPKEGGGGTRECLKEATENSVVPVSICYYSSSTSSKSITFLITVPVPVLESKSFQLLF